MLQRYWQGGEPVGKEQVKACYFENVSICFKSGFVQAILMPLQRLALCIFFQEYMRTRLPIYIDIWIHTMVLVFMTGNSA